MAAQCVRRLIDEPGLLEHLSRSAAESHQGKHTFEGSMDAWADGFDKCLALQLKRGKVPRVPDRLDGRLGRWGVPVGIQSAFRQICRRPVKHVNPGAEWPTHSGLITHAERLHFQRFAIEAEATDSRRS